MPPRRTSPPLSGPACHGYSNPKTPDWSLLTIMCIQGFGRRVVAAQSSTSPCRSVATRMAIETSTPPNFAPADSLVIGTPSAASQHPDTHGQHCKAPFILSKLIFLHTSCSWNFRRGTASAVHAGSSAANAAGRSSAPAGAIPAASGATGPCPAEHLELQGWRAALERAQSHGAGLAKGRGQCLWHGAPCNRGLTSTCLAARTAAARVCAAQRPSSNPGMQWHAGVCLFLDWRSLENGASVLPAVPAPPQPLLHPPQNQTHTHRPTRSHCWRSRAFTCPRTSRWHAWPRSQQVPTPQCRATPAAAKRWRTCCPC